MIKNLKYPRRLIATRGFTLIELLTVIAVIALLAGILVAGLQKARASAEKAKCVGHWRQYDTALKLYVGDHQGKLPVSKFTKTDEVWIQLSPYFSFEGVEGLKGQKLSNVQGYIRKDASCPDEDWGYGFNVFVSEKPIAAVQMPAKTIYGIDLKWPNRWFDGTVIEGGSAAGKLARATPKPHSGMVTVLYLDGHVETKYVSEIMRAELMRESQSYTLSDEDEPIADPDYDV